MAFSLLLLSSLLASIIRMKSETDFSLSRLALLSLKKMVTNVPVEVMSMEESFVWQRHVPCD